MQIGNGHDTNVWTDKWLPVVPPRRITRNPTYFGSNDDMKVCELWTEETMTWNINKLEEMFTLETMKVCELWTEETMTWNKNKLKAMFTLAQTIWLSRFAPKDKFVWPYAKDSLFCKIRILGSFS